MSNKYFKRKLSTFSKREHAVLTCMQLIFLGSIVFWKTIMYNNNNRKQEKHDTVKRYDTVSARDYCSLNTSDFMQHK